MPFAPGQQQPQATGLGGMTVGPDLAADLAGKSGTFIAKLGSRYVLVVAAPGHSIKSAVAIPDVPDSWMTFQISTRQSQLAISGQGAATAASRSRSRASRARPATP